MQALDTLGMKRKRRVVLSSAENQDPSALIPTANYCLPQFRGRVTLKIIITETRGSFSRCYTIRADLRLD